MKIEKVNIENYKCFKGQFSLELNPDINILVGNNEAGKSTILEAIHLALSGMLNGKYLKNELTQYLFNNEVVYEYIASDKTQFLPQILIEVYFSGEESPLFEGNGNSEKAKGCGVSFKIEFDIDYQDEYEALIKSGDINSIPIEYYKISWKSFARESISSRSIPIRSVLIDSSSNRYQNGSDVYISRIIRDSLDDDEKAKISQAYRKMKDVFMQEDSVQAINNKIKDKAKVSEKEVKISVDLSTRNAWETTLMTYLDDIPFHQIGMGEQCIVKTNLALDHKKSKEANLILLEEPENHLSHTKLNQFVKSIQDNCKGKQIIISTHNSFVANKLGLDYLMLLNNQKVIRLTALQPETQNFFKKLPGYQTLRLILCEKAILVEGDSDELVVQKAYMKFNEGKLPIENGLDVISVKLTFKRFLEIAEKIDKQVVVITDNDGDFENNITKKYQNFDGKPFIKICADDRNELKTLEPQFVDANKDQLDVLCRAIGVNQADYNTESDIVKYMISNKTTWSLRLFESDEPVRFPKYIIDAIKWCNE